MFSQTAEYAMRAAVTLASQEGRPMKTREISEAAQIPVDYLFKVLRSLSKAGIVQIVRGVGGGVRLSKPSEKITILEIVAAIDPLPRITECPLDLEAHREKLCPLHHHLDKAMGSVEDALKKVTLAEVSRDSSGGGPFCERERKVPAPSGSKRKRKGRGMLDRRAQRV